MVDMAWLHEQPCAIARTLALALPNPEQKHLKFTVSKCFGMVKHTSSKRCLAWQTGARSGLKCTIKGPKHKSRPELKFLSTSLDLNSKLNPWGRSGSQEHSFCVQLKKHTMPLARTLTPTLAPTITLKLVSTVQPSVGYSTEPGDGGVARPRLGVGATGCWSWGYEGQHGA